MRYLKTHFAPAPTRLSVGSTAGRTLVCVSALAGIPAMVRDAFGDRVLRAGTQSAMLDLERIEDQDCFIPHAVMTNFLTGVERASGESRLGLILAPHLKLQCYGCWGAHVLGARNLGEAIRRAGQTIHYHSLGDRVGVLVRDGHARFAYASAARGRDGYFHVAIGTLGVMLSLCREYLPGTWRPLRIEIDAPWSDGARDFEDVFECPVVFDANVLSVIFEPSELQCARPRDACVPLLTAADVARARGERAERSDLAGVIAAYVWTQVLAGHASVEATAHALDLSTRTLQRELNSAGTSFRMLVNTARTWRAVELLRGTDMLVSDISKSLGYSSPAHFARAVRRETDLSPVDHRRPGQHAGRSSPGLQ